MSDIGADFGGYHQLAELEIKKLKAEIERLRFEGDCKKTALQELMDELSTAYKVIEDSTAEIERLRAERDTLKDRIYTRQR